MSDLQIEKKKYCMISLLYGILKKKMVHMNLFTEQKETHREQTYGCWEKDEGER